MSKIRIEGYLKQLKTANIPYNMLFFDCETWVHGKGDHNELPLRLGVGIYVKVNKDIEIKKRETFIFRSSVQFFDYVERYLHKKYTLYIFAHNIGFDIRVLNLPRLFMRYNYESEPPIINERMFIWKVKTPKGNMQFIDTANLGVYSVAQIGEVLGFAKGEVDFNTPNERLLRKYCERDTEIIERYVVSHLKFLHDHDLGGFRVTIASQALSTYRYKFMHNPPYIHNDTDVIQLERDSYHGGRTECFFIGKPPDEHFYYLDINSMYPYCMKYSRLPQKLRNYYNNVSVSFLKQAQKNVYIIARCVVNTDEPVYALYKDSKLIFPIGTFETVLNDCELQYALEHNHIVSCSECATYETNDLFSEYVDFFYALKAEYTKQGNKPYREVTKLFLNSLYGKFGQMLVNRELESEDETIEIFRETGYCEPDDYFYSRIGWYGKIYLEYKSGETPHTHVAIASAITSNARMLLWTYIKRATRDHVFYCDTDSLFVDSVGYRNLVDTLHPTKLGALSIEDESDKLVIHNPKDYQFGETVKIKGIKKNSKQIDDNQWEVLLFEGFISWLNNGAKTTPINWNTIKGRRSEYSKGVVTSSGRVIPIKL